MLAAALREKRIDVGNHTRKRVARLLRRYEVIALVGKVERRLEPCHDVEQRLFNRADGRGQRALELIERRARLQRRHGLDQVGDRLGLDQIQLAVEKRAQRKLARLGQPRARRHRPTDNRGQHHRAAMCRDFGNVFTGV